MRPRTFHSAALRGGFRAALLPGPPSSTCLPQTLGARALPTSNCHPRCCCCRYLKNLSSGALVLDGGGGGGDASANPLRTAAGDYAFMTNSRTLLFTTLSADTHRAHQVWRLQLGSSGAAAGAPELLFEEPDERFQLNLWRSRSGERRGSGGCRGRLAGAVRRARQWGVMEQG